VIFPDDSANSTVYLLSRRLKLILFQSILLGELPPEQVRALTRIVALQPIMGAAEDDVKADRLSITASSLVGWAETRELRVLASNVRALVFGRLIQRHKRSSQEIVRLARSLPLYRDTHEASVNFLTEQNFPRFDIVNIGALSFVSEDWRRPFRGVGILEDLHLAERRLFGIYRIRGRTYGAESNAGYSYSGIASLTKGRVVLLIGCGYGSGAAVLLSAGCTHVIGLDYYDDLNPVEVMRGNTVPPAILRTGHQSKFTRVNVDSKRTGNIFSRDTADLLKDYSGAGTLIIVDIRLKTESEYCSLLNTLRGFLGAAEVFLRFVGSVSDFKCVLATLVVSGMYHEARCVFSRGDYCEAWLIITYNEKTKLTGGILAGDIIFPENSLRYPDLSFLGGGRDFLEKMIKGPYYGLPSDEILTNAVVLDHALDASIGGTDHRFSYNQFTAVLHAFMFREIMQSTDPFGKLVQFAQTGKMTVQLRGRTIHLEKNPQLVSTLMVLMPRMFDLL
jgi:hypothetical protein